jgi:hypothetical protein
MFGLFKKKPEFVSEDKVWKNDAVKFNAMLDLLKSAEKFILIYYFQDTKSKAETVMRDAAVAFSEHATPNDRIVLVQADHLQKQFSLSDRTVFFLEHHPSYNTEQAIIAQLQALGFIKVVFLNSFDDPILSYFGANIIALLEKLGFEDHEVIEHNMITQSIKNAQQKIDAKVTYPSATRNAKDWIATNIGGTVN